MFFPAPSSFSQKTHGKRSGIKLQDCANLGRRPASISGNLPGLNEARKIIEELTTYWPGDYTIVRHSSQPFVS
jgi:hypothetical protein